MLVTYVIHLPKGRRKGLFAAQIISGITQEGADCRMNVKVAAPAFQIIHYTVDLDEASCGVALLCEDMLFYSSMLLNMPAPGPILAGYTAYSKKRCSKLARQLSQQQNVNLQGHGEKDTQPATTPDPAEPSQRQRR